MAERCGEQHAQQRLSSPKYASKFTQRSVGNKKRQRRKRRKKRKNRRRDKINYYASFYSDTRDKQEKMPR
jgi:hypothetical protein